MVVLLGVLKIAGAYFLKPYISYKVVIRPSPRDRLFLLIIKPNDIIYGFFHRKVLFFTTANIRTANVAFHTDP